MTTVLAYNPMSDPFASQSAIDAAGRRQSDSARAGRYSTPPQMQFQPQGQPIQMQGALFGRSTPPAIVLAQSAASIAQRATMDPRMSGASSSLAANEFGSLSRSASQSQSTPSSSRSRASHHPSTVPLPLPLPMPNTAQPIATSSSMPYTAVPIAGSSHSAVTPPSGQPQRARQRQSHNPSATLANTSPPRPEYLTDEYVLHPSVYAYKQAHPRRPMVGFGPYVLLQTLGEGEFGKVKLGVHTEYGVEVAVKLIRRGSLEDQARASKVEREIDVLKSIKHPNIVRMFDVIDTEKYIGIVLEYAGGGELFDHILANKYLKEKDAAKLFAQLISGVDYLHKKNIIHRDLKLENLLLDKHRNIIITDFGFANRSDPAGSDGDLMATSCGSPCYAAPELVVSEGLYSGSSADIWSCGVILYAMLCGYLPFDDDPANPEGDNINLLYKYIISTELAFPDHLSEQVKDLLRIMLVPNPEFRCTIEDIVSHPWLVAHRELFARSVEMNEWIFQDSMYQKSQQAKMQLAERRRVQAEVKMAARVARSQSTAPGMGLSSAAAGGPASLDPHKRRHQSAMPATIMTSVSGIPPGPRTPPLSAAPMLGTRTALAGPTPVQAITQSSPVVAPAEILPSTPTGAHLRAASPPSASASVRARLASLTPQGSGTLMPSAKAVENEPLSPRTRDGSPAFSANRHTIQVEYDVEASYERMREEAMSSQSRAPPGAAEDGDVFTADRSGDVEMLAATEEPATEAALVDEAAHARSPSRSEDASTAQVPVPSSEAEVGTSATPAPVAQPEAVPAVVPSTPSKRKSVPAEDDQSGRRSPSTPKARRSAEAEQESTPRAKSAGLADAAAAITPRAREKSADSRPAAAVAAVPSQETGPALVSLPASTSGSLNELGLPQPAAASKPQRSRKGMSLDKFGFAKILGGGSASAASGSTAPAEVSKVKASVPPMSASAAQAVQIQQQQPSSGATGLLRSGSLRDRMSKRDSASVSSAAGKRMSMRPQSTEPTDKKSKRRTLQQFMGSRPPSSNPAPLTARDSNLAVPTASQPLPPVVTIAGMPTSERGLSSPSLPITDAYAGRPGATTAASGRGDSGRQDGTHHRTASSSAAKKVMDWFRRKSIARDPALSGVGHPASSSAAAPAAGQDVIRSDSASSFVRIGEEDEEGRGRAGRVASGPTMLATVSTANLAMSSTSSIAQTAESVRAATPLQTAIAAAGEEQSIPAQTRADGAPLMPSRSQSHNPDVQHATEPVAQPAPVVPQTALPAVVKPIARSSTAVPGQLRSGATTAPGGPYLSTSANLSTGVLPGSDESKLRIHTGLVDQAALSSLPPREVMNEVLRVLLDMGMEVKRENEFRLRCTRVRRRKGGNLSAAVTGLGIGGVSANAGASISRTDSRGLPSMSTSPSMGGILSTSGLKGMLLRRGSAAAANALPRTESADQGLSSGLGTSPAASSSVGLTPVAPSLPTIEPLYGEHSVDSGDEVKFNVELCRMKNLPGLYHLSIKRLKGGVWSFKFIYQTVLERCETLTH